MFLTRALFLIGALALGGAIYWALGADARGLVPVLAEMTSEPWTVVTLIDLYLGFFIAAALIFMVEENKLTAAFWALPIFFLGNIWTALWLVIRLPAFRDRMG